MTDTVMTGYEARLPAVATGQWRRRFQRFEKLAGLSRGLTTSSALDLSGTTRTERKIRPHEGHLKRLRDHDYRLASYIWLPAKPTADVLQTSLDRDGALRCPSDWSPTMIHSRSKHGTRKVSPPGPSYMNEEQIATYLKDLRTNRPPRPNGSRPFPTKSISSSQKLRSDLPPRASSALSMNIDSENHRVSSLEPYQRSASALSHHRKHSTLSNGSVSTEQSLEEEPEQSYDLSRSLSPAASIRSTTGTYRVRGQRWMEREEARSLRQALEEMDFRDDEKRLHAAAQEEATQLVFSHQTSGFPKLNPHAPYLNPDLIATNQFRQHLKKGAYARSQSRESPEFQRRVDPTGSNLSPKIVDVPEDNETISVTKNGTLTQKPRVNFALETDNSNSPRTVVQRKASSADEDCHNPKGDDTPQTKDGKEIRGDDIRAATSMRLKDRSSKLPMPTVVSDRPGRPIVSFDPSWSIKSQSNSPRDSPRNSLVGSIKEPAVEVTPPPGNVVPAIKVSDDPPAPVINVCGDDSAALTVSSSGVPTIAEMKAAEEKPRPLPNPSASQNGKQNQRNSRGSSTNRWYTPYTRTGAPTASCSACGLPIAGRIVTACGSRFHAECFSCHHCHTPLECVAFYQEPEGKRAERLADADSNDEEANALRFYCHLDFHELFSPRCKSCKTPIEGEVVVACGAEWHVGHFFCAECGDPFTPTTPFVEHAGYAWCVRCHSKRTASRCQGCKQLVLDDLVVTALGGEWHEKCFVCSECSGSFGPEGRFFVREGKQRFTKNGRPIIGSTDTAVCEACEGRRLKA
ncbi:predicted protein [Histoplasma mississippiense (nom. inval.)]|uniref:predicted protein n=1 Tax=Ajellomyces capsulatus (strain NAm1 / WU24) TaxID=2059318 RepID=UPI000157CCA7|nr:predicted protein [Histoplasma mississippiense (nom. inval.)]EDN10332.1 predicted protein [Histoplasma mississippiense (nom. inval.)]